MTVQPDEKAVVEMGRAQRIALRTAQCVVLVLAGWRLFRLNRDEAGALALAWSIPWAILLVVAALLIPALVNLGWRRFGRVGPTWTIATIVSTSVWGVATIFCWMMLGLVLLASD